VGHGFSRDIKQCARSAVDCAVSLATCIRGSSPKREGTDSGPRGRRPLVPGPILKFSAMQGVTRGIAREAEGKSGDFVRMSDLKVRHQTSARSAFRCAVPPAACFPVIAQTRKRPYPGFAEIGAWLPDPGARSPLPNHPRQAGIPSGSREERVTTHQSSFHPSLATSHSPTELP